MSHTNSTTNYGLPQFLTGDKPAWLTDINNAFSDIDTAVYNAQTKANTAFTDAGNAQIDATTAINDAAAADAKGSGALASIEVTFDPTTIYSVGAKVIYNSLLYRCIVAVTTPGPWTGSDNWERITVDSLISTSDSKIGSLTSLSTTDKTSIVNAVNEVNGSIGNLSQLTTANKSSIVGAINSFLPRVVYSEKNWANTHSFATPNDTAFMLYTDSDTSVAKVRIFNNNQASIFNISGSSITGVTYANGTLTVSVTNRGLVAVRII